MSFDDRIKLQLSFDVEPMQQEVLALPLHGFLEYSVLPLTAPTPVAGPLSGETEPVRDYADGSWADWKNTAFLQSSPYLSEVVEFFRSNTAVTLVRLLRLAPGGLIKEHCDPTLGLEVEEIRDPTHHSHPHQRCSGVLAQWDAGGHGTWGMLVSTLHRPSHRLEQGRQGADPHVDPYDSE